MTTTNTAPAPAVDHLEMRRLYAAEEAKRRKARRERAATVPHPALLRCKRRECGYVLRVFTLRPSDTSVVILDDAGQPARRYDGYGEQCPACGAGHSVRLNRIEGKRNDSVRCDERCESAKGFRCECSCSGKNHGASHGGAA
jgi:hypothetical protein